MLAEAVAAVLVVRGGRVGRVDDWPEGVVPGVVVLWLLRLLGHIDSVGVSIGDDMVPGGGASSGYASLGIEAAGCDGSSSGRSMAARRGVFLARPVL